MIRIVATFRVRLDAVEELRAFVDELVETSRIEDGNLAYGLHVAGDDSASFVMPETWHNGTVIEAHNASTHFTILVPRMVSLYAEPSSVVQYAEVWTHNTKATSVTGGDAPR